MRTFVNLRKLLSEQDLPSRVEKLEKGTDKLFRIVFERLENVEEQTPLLPIKRRRIGIKS